MVRIKISNYYVNQIQLYLYLLACGGYLKIPDQTTLRYPEPNITSTYQSNLNCVWTLVANDSFVLNISFVWIDIEKSNNCKFDYIEVKRLI